MARRRRNAEQLRALQSEALNLRTSGLTYRQIATKLDVSLRSAYLYVQTELASLEPLRQAAAERYRDLEVTRLDRMYLELSKRISPPQGQQPPDDQRLVSLVHAALGVGARRAKLLGLDAPTKVAQTDASGQDGPVVKLTANSTCGSKGFRNSLRNSGSGTKRLIQKRRCLEFVR